MISVQKFGLFLFLMGSALPTRAFSAVSEQTLYIFGVRLDERFQLAKIDVRANDQSSYDWLLTPFSDVRVVQESDVRFSQADGEVLIDRLADRLVHFIKTAGTLTESETGRVMDEAVYDLFRIVMAVQETPAMKLKIWIDYPMTVLIGSGFLFGVIEALGYWSDPKFNHHLTAMGLSLTGSVTGLTAYWFNGGGVGNASERGHLKQKLVLFKRFFKSVATQLNWNFENPSPELKYLMMPSDRTMACCSCILDSRAKKNKGSYA